MIRWKLLSSAHDVSDGGLAIALAECCIMNQEKMFGANCTLSNFVRADFALFGESQSMIVISFAPKFRSRIEEVCVMRAVPFVQLGRVEGRALRIAEHIEITCERMAVDYDAAIPRWMER
jgi:phosphoribosylformylglycinamidine synthase